MAYWNGWKKPVEAVAESFRYSWFMICWLWRNRHWKSTRQKWKALDREWQAYEQERKK